MSGGLRLQHDLERAREHEHDVDDVEDAEAEEQPHLLQVARRAAHDLAGRHLPVERRAQALELAKELEAQLVLGVAARVEDVPAARDAGDERRPARGRASSAAGRHAVAGSAPKTASIAAFDCQSMRFIANWNAASASVPGDVLRRVPAELTAQRGRERDRLHADPRAARSSRVSWLADKSLRSIGYRCSKQRLPLSGGRSRPGRNGFSVRARQPRPAAALRPPERGCSTSSRTASSPSITRAPPLPSSSCTTPTLPENGPLSTWTRAPRSMTTGEPSTRAPARPGRGGSFASRPRPRGSGGLAQRLGLASRSASGSRSRSRPRARATRRAASIALVVVAIEPRRSPRRRERRRPFAPLASRSAAREPTVRDVGAQQREDLRERDDGVREVLVEQGGVLHGELAGHAPADPHRRPVRARPGRAAPARRPPSRAAPRRSRRRRSAPIVNCSGNASRAVASSSARGGVRQPRPRGSGLGRGQLEARRARARRPWRARGASRRGAAPRTTNCTAGEAASSLRRRGDRRFDAEVREPLERRRSAQASMRRCRSGRASRGRAGRSPPGAAQAAASGAAWANGRTARASGTSVKPRLRLAAPSSEDARRTREVHSSLPSRIWRRFGDAGSPSAGA